jgi:hypothetical protein
VANISKLGQDATGFSPFSPPLSYFDPNQHYIAIPAYGPKSLQHNDLAHLARHLLPLHRHIGHDMAEHDATPTTHVVRKGQILSRIYGGYYGKTD